MTPFHMLLFKLLSKVKYVDWLYFHKFIFCIAPAGMKDTQTFLTKLQQKPFTKTDFIFLKKEL